MAKVQFWGGDQRKRGERKVSMKINKNGRKNKLY